MTSDQANAGAAPKLMLLFIAMSYFLAYFDRLLMAVIGEMVKHEFHLSDKQLSLLTGATFVILYGASGIVAGWLVDHVNRKRVIVWALAFWSLCTIACGLAQSFAQLAIARAGVGIGESPAVPSGISVITDLYPRAKRPMAIAVFYAGGMGGILACFLLGTWAATHYGWRAAFFVAGPPGLLLSLLVLRFAKEPVRETPITRNSAGLSQSSFGLVLRNRPLRWLLLAGSIATYVNMSVLTWLPMFFARSHGLSIQQVGWFFGPVLAAGMATGLLLGGVIGNRIAARSFYGLFSISGWSMFVLIPIYMMIFWLPSLVAALVATFIGTALSVVYAPSYNTAYQTICDARARGTAVGLSSFANAMIGGALCSFLVGALSDYLAPTLGKESLRYALTGGMSFCLISGSLFFVSARLHRREASGSAYAT